jgi:hypothetical protein
MILVAMAFAADCDAVAAVSTLKASGKREAYDCVRSAESAKEPLINAIIADPTNVRLTRAMALWLLERGDAAWDPTIVVRLPAADRRLLGDGVRARRGRKTPSPEHEAVFSQLDWYHPVSSYTDAKLTPVDRANIALADKPPPLPKPGEEAVVAVEAAQPSRSCGCGGASAGLFFPLLTLFSRRSRGRIPRSL